MQMKTPRFHDAQRGFLLVLQSAQNLLCGLLRRCWSRALFLAVVALDLLCDILLKEKVLINFTNWEFVIV